MMCAQLGVSVSGYWQHRQSTAGPGFSKKGPTRVSDDVLLAHIKAIHVQFKGEYGWPRVWRALLVQGVRVGKERVRKLMQRHGIRARGKRRFRVVTTDSKHDLAVAPNRLERCFTVDRPNAVWTSDITYIGTQEGWLYLAVVIDLFSRQVVGWSMKPHMKAELVTDALSMACWRRRPPKGLIFHTDRGSQYCSHECRTLTKAWGIQSSMSRKGDCWDNAPTESLWGSLKVGRIYGQTFETRRQAMDEIVDWLTFYNHTRLHSTLGYVSPMQFEKSWYAVQLKKAA